MVGRLDVGVTRRGVDVDLGATRRGEGLYWRGWVAFQLLSNCRAVGLGVTRRGVAEIGFVRETEPTEAEEGRVVPDGATRRGVDGLGATRRGGGLPGRSVASRVGDVRGGGAETGALRLGVAEAT